MSEQATGTQRVMIPTVGQVLTLAENWTFTLHAEYRNFKFSEVIGQSWISNWYAPPGERDREARTVVLPAGTILKVARVYIRGTSHNARSFDSLTFTLVKVPEKKWKGRFWAKLADVNRMVCAVEAEVRG
jgi:hypothetical protein